MEEIICNKIYNKFGKNNVKDIHIEENNDYHGNYFAWWSVLENNRWIDYRQYF